MKATRTTLIAALMAGGLLALSPALRADDATNTPPSAPPAGAWHHGPRGPGMRGPNFDRLAERLNLTDDQKSKVKAIFESQRQKMRDLWQDQNLSRADRRTKMQSIREATDTKLKAVLSADQFKKFQEMRHMRRGPRNGPPRWGPGPNQSGTNAPAATSPQS